MLAILAVSALSIGPQAGSATEGSSADFDLLWRTVKERYAYLDRSGLDWDRAREHHRARLAQARSPQAVLGVFEDLLEELRDHHVHLNTNNERSPRLVPSELDLWVEWIDGVALVTSVRLGTDAARSGIKPGDEVLELRGQASGDLAARRLGRDSGEFERGLIGAEDMGWALRVELAGRRSQERTLLISGTEGVREIHLGRNWAPPLDGLLRSERLTVQDKKVGIIRIHNSLGNNALVEAFDRAIAELEDTQALVIDLRETPGGGNSTVARGILGHFVTAPRPYQRHILVAEGRNTGVPRSWQEEVWPRGAKPFGGRVVVLVGRWTGSMGEGLALGFDAIGVEVMGDPMAGLLGALTEVSLPHSGWIARFANEALTHIDGTPREAWIPPHRAQDGDPSDERDEVLNAAVILALE